MKRYNCISKIVMLNLFQHLSTYKVLVKSVCCKIPKQVRDDGLRYICLGLLLLLIAPQAYADLLTGSYVSPETYAVNEADLQDYRYAPPAPKLNIDNLEDMRFKAPNLVGKDIQIGSGESVAEQEEKFANVDKKSKKSKKEKLSKEEKKAAKAQQEELQPYQKKLSYKFAKWWVDQRYKREESHHGDLHEIKVNKRIENENKEVKPDN